MLKKYFFCLFLFISLSSLKVQASGCPEVTASIYQVLPYNQTYFEIIETNLFLGAFTRYLTDDNAYQSSVSITLNAPLVSNTLYYTICLGENYTTPSSTNYN